MPNPTLSKAVNAAIARGEPVITERRPIYVIAREIRRVWPKPYFGAVPYLGAMLSLEDMRSAYGADSARSVVIYFLSNATTWRGPDARRIKAELNEILDVKPQSEK